MYIPSNLKMLRAKHNKSQQEMSMLLNISLTGYSKKENGRNPFTLEEAKKISEIFKLSIENIFFAELVHVNGTASNY